MNSTQKQREIGRKSMAIKARGFNKVKNFFNPKHESFKTPDAEKMETIQKIMNETYSELRAYKWERQRKAKIEKARVDRGYKPKVKTSKEQYLQMQQVKEASPSLTKVA